MLKEVFASKAAKLVAACVCPVAVGTVALKVPPVRSAIHKATAPKPQKEARAKPRIRAPLKKAVDRDEDLALVQTPLICPPPILLKEAALEPPSFQLPQTPIPMIDAPREASTYVANCGPSPSMASFRTGVAVPEPETWAQMVAGFALMGATIRAGRRRQRHSPA